MGNLLVDTGGTLTGRHDIQGHKQDILTISEFEFVFLAYSMMIFAHVNLAV